MIVYKYTKCINIVFLIISICGFCLGIFQAVYIKKYKNNSNSLTCIDLSHWLTAALILNIVSSFITLCNIAKHYIYNDDLSLIFNFSQIFGYIFIGIWSVVVYFDINNWCYHFVLSYYTGFWTFVIIHFVIFWIIIIVIIVCIILYLYYDYMKN
jgi:hypothetical protein